jgi:hypothetical protein
MTDITRFQCAALLAAAAIVSAFAQSQTPPPGQTAPLRFEVASIKANRSDEPFPLLASDRGQYLVNNVPLRTLIQAAFQVLYGLTPLDPMTYAVVRQRYSHPPLRFSTGRIRMNASTAWIWPS